LGAVVLVRISALTIAAITTAQAQQQCLTQQLGPSACADLVAPTCAPGQGVRIEAGIVPFCADESISPAKAAAELKEAELRQAALAATHLSLFVGGGLVLAFAIGAWLVLRD
jgi:hypothetical protein